MPVGARPEWTSANENGMTLPSSSATIQRIGRMKRGLSAPVQYMERGQAISRITSGSAFARISVAGRPYSVCFTARYSPFGVLTIESFESGTPCFSAKLTAARVGSPAASKATDFGGPVISRVTSSCFTRSPRAMARAFAGRQKLELNLQLSARRPNGASPIASQVSL